MSQLETSVVGENEQSRKRKRSLDGSMSPIQRQINNLRADLAKLEHEQEMQKICKAASQGVPTQGNGSNQSSMPLYRKRGSQVSLSNCAEIFCFLEEYGVLVCKQHRTAVINLDKHLSQHHSVPASSRRQIVDCFSRLKQLDPAEIKLPEEPAQPIEELGRPTSRRTSRLGLYSCLIRHSARVRRCFILSRPSSRPSGDSTSFHSPFGFSSAVARRAHRDKLHLFAVTLYTCTLFVNKGQLFLSSCP
jgi:hypothetical protein